MPAASAAHNLSMDILRKGATGEATDNVGHFGSHTRSTDETVLVAFRLQPGEYQDVTRDDWLGRTYDVEVNTATGLTDDEFTTADTSAVEALLWSGITDEGDPLDAEHGIYDIAAEARWKLAADLHTFIASNRDIVDQALRSKTYGADSGDGTGALGQLGHDFLLTRNRSGAGFWDRSTLPGELGRQLTAAAHEFPELDVYVGDDGKVYV